MTMPRPDHPQLEAEVAELRRKVLELEATGAREQSALRYFDAMEKVNHIIGRTADLDQLLIRVLDQMLELFQCDRAWLLYPCDPSAPAFRVPMERARPAWPGAFRLGVEVPMDPTVAEVLELALLSDGPVIYDPGSGRAIPAGIVEAFSVRSQMLSALFPKTGLPWVLGLHHCERAHVFTEVEQRIFSGVCRRMGDALGTLIARRDLEASVRRFRTLFENAPEAVVVMDAEGGILDANPNAARLLRCDAHALKGHRLDDFGAPGGAEAEPLPRMLAQAVAGAGPRFEWTCLGEGDEARTCEVRLVLLESGDQPLVRASILDVTDQIATQRQLLHLQKMEAVGELAGGIAHDFNNQLSVVLCYSDLLRMLPGMPPRVAEYSGRIVHAAEEAAALTHQLLAFSRRSLLRGKVVDLNEVVSALATLLTRAVGSHIELRIVLWARPLLVKVDRQQIEQVLVNLVNNARDALPKGGHLRVATEPRAVAEAEVGRTGLAEGAYAALVVADDGVGMDAPTRARIFEPFFTTKERGKGTGLGLSTAFGVVSQSEGTIQVESQLGVGTTFTVYLPVASEPVAADPRSTDPGSAPTGHETVLIVEDQSEVAEVAAEVLRSAGYRVLVVCDGRVALERQARGEHFDLLITDVNLPGIDGVELAERIVANKPGLPVLFCSGYSARALARLGHSALQVEFLQKPYRPDQLLRRVRSVLDGRYR